MSTNKKSSSGRVTPKSGAHAGTNTGRYTPPIDHTYEESPRWVAILMFILFGLGLVTILANYLSFLPGSPSNWYLLVGLGFITFGFGVATQLK